MIDFKRNTKSGPALSYQVDVSVTVQNCSDGKKRMRFSFSCDAYERAFQTAQYLIAGTDPNHPTRIYFRQSSPSEGFKMSCYSKAGRKVLLFGALRPVQGDIEDMVGKYKLQQDHNGVVYIDQKERNTN